MTPYKINFYFAKFDFMFVTASWFRSSEPDCFLLSKLQYTVHRKDRNGYGGVAVFIRNVLSIVHIDLPNDFPTIECVVLDVLEFRDCLYHFICLYNSPSLANSMMIHI